MTSAYIYSAFGELRGTDAPETRYLYTGQQYDATTQLYSLRARVYNPTEGRFLSRDTWAYNDMINTVNRMFFYVSGILVGELPNLQKSYFAFELLESSIINLIAFSQSTGVSGSSRNIIAASALNKLALISRAVVPYLVDTETDIVDRR